MLTLVQHNYLLSCSKPAACYFILFQSSNIIPLTMLLNLVKELRFFKQQKCLWNWNCL